jgi:hypothetical protein
MSKGKTGTFEPSISSIFLANLMDSGQPLVFIPMSTMFSTPLFLSIISCAILNTALSIAFPSIINALIFIVPSLRISFTNIYTSQSHSPIYILGDIPLPAEAFLIKEVCPHTYIVA